MLTDRRTLLAGLAVLPAAAMLPTAIAAALPASAPPLIFDPVAYVADLTAAGYGVTAFHAVPCGGEPAGPPSYLIRPPKGRGFSASYSAVMAKWWDAITLCPDHAERVANHVFEQARRAAA